MTTSFTKKGNKVVLDRTLFEVRVKESDQNREYWVNRPWLEERRAEVREADVLILPWVNFRQEGETLFPLRTGDFVTKLAQLSEMSVAIAVDRTGYHEILMHSKEHRFPAMLVSAVLLPAFATVIGNLATDAVKGAHGQATVELSVIVEGNHGRCISVDYKGPPDRLASVLLDEVDRCLPSRKQPQRKPQRSSSGA